MGIYKYLEIFAVILLGPPNILNKAWLSIFGVFAYENILLVSVTLVNTSNLHFRDEYSSIRMDHVSFRGEF